jgi:hypothetical protein
MKVNTDAGIWRRRVLKVENPNPATMIPPNCEETV